jgi:parallel beta-helix repeat protein
LPHCEILATRDLPSGAVITVHAGASIQAAVDAARAGTVIRIEPGTYTQAIRVATPDLTLAGVTGPGGRVLLTNPGHAANGITVTAAARDFVLDNVTVRGFGANGVLLQGVHGFRIAHVNAEDDGEYGLFPVLSSAGLIEACRASGHRDTGIYVGQSTDVTIRACTASANVNGLEVENSTDVRVLDNQAHDNSAGLLIDLLPGLQVKTDAGIVAEGNRLQGNNRPNTANPHDIASAVPAGVGILVLGAKRTLIHKNTVTHNDFVGIGVASTELLGQLANVPARAFAGIDPLPRDVMIEDNSVVHNGSKSPIPLAPPADFLWDGTGTGNVWIDNRFGRSFPRPLPAH